MTAHTLVWDPNPTIDVALSVDRLKLTGVHHASAQEVGIGGKGTLLLLALTRLGFSASGTAPVGGAVGTLIETIARSYNLPMAYDYVAEGSRVAVTVVDDATHTDINVNGVGPPVRDPTWDGHIQAVRQRISSGRPEWVVIAGRPPQRGAEDAGLTRVIDAARRVGSKIAADVATPSLSIVLANGVDLLKINRREATDGLGVPSRTPAYELARGLVEAGARIAVVTDGPGPVAVSTSDGQLFSVEPPRVTLRSAIGCGDCFFAGLLNSLLRGNSGAQKLRQATATAVGIASAAAETLRPGDFDRDRGEALAARATIHDIRPDP